MKEITELEGRLSAALDRIRRGMEAARAGAAETGEAQELAANTAALEAQLGEERTANAQLEERLRTLGQRQETTVAALEKELRGYRERFAGIDRDLQRLRQVNAELRDINARMRDAMAEDMAEPHLVNKALLAEIEALRATQAADRAEVEAVLGELKPLIEETG